jgi:hypothetical protein
MTSIIGDVADVILSPGKTIANTMSKKKWVAVFVLILAVSSFVTYLTYPVTKLEQAKFIRNSELANRLPEEQLENLDKFTPAQRLTGTLFPIPITALTLVVAAFFIYLFFKIGGTDGTYMNFFSGVVHASIIDMVLGGILKSALVVSQKSIMVSTGLGLLSPTSDFRNLGYLVLAQFDFFTIWYLVALAFGIAQFANIKPRKSILIAFAYFVFKAIVLVSFSYFTMRLMRI